MSINILTGFVWRNFAKWYCMLVPSTTILFNFYQLRAWKHVVNCSYCKLYYYARELFVVSIVYEKPLLLWMYCCFFSSEFQEFLLRWKNGIWVKLFFEGRIHFDSVSGWNLFNWIELETLSSFENLNFYPSCLCNNNVCLELLLCTLSVCSASNTAFKTFLFFLFNTEKNFELTLHFAQ